MLLRKLIIFSFIAASSFAAFQGFAGLEDDCGESVSQICREQSFDNCGNCREHNSESVEPVSNSIFNSIFRRGNNNGGGRSPLQYSNINSASARLQADWLLRPHNFNYSPFCRTQTSHSLDRLMRLNI